MLNVDALPYLTAQIPGIGGEIKSRPQDFIVEEVPLYAPSGEGTHVYFQIEKHQLTTMQAIQQIARAIGRAPRDIGYAGLKDAEAVTRQMFSIEHIDPDKIAQLDLPRIRMLEISRHRNKLKLGHLAGNTFIIRLRNVDIGRVTEARAVMEILHQRGAPNYFGPQRFGIRGDTWEIGRAILHHNADEALALMLGRPGPRDYGDVKHARELYEQGKFEEAAAAWKYPFYHERRVCYAVASNKSRLDRAIKAVDPQLKRFYISAYQSQLFNQVVARRLQQLDQLFEGDLAWRHPQGAVFRVDDVAKEQPRCDVFEISPTGPLFGYRMSEPDGPAAEAERAVLADEGLTLENWRDGANHKIKGARRPLRFQPQKAAIEPGRDTEGDYIEIRFFLQSGCYATCILREICKTDVGQLPETNE